MTNFEKIAKCTRFLLLCFSIFTCILLYASVATYAADSAGRSVKITEKHTAGFSNVKPEIIVQLGHTNKINTVATSPDGRLALSGSADNTLKLWDLNTGKEIRTFSGHVGSVLSVAISPDGRLALSGSDDKTLKLWDINTGKEIRTFWGHVGSVLSADLSQDGRFALSGSGDTTMTLWDINTGEAIRTFLVKEGITSVAFSPDGRFAISGGAARRTLRLWEISTGKEIRTFSGHTDYVSSAAISRDGRFVLSGSGDKTLKLWNIKTGKEIRTFSGHTGYVSSAAISRDGRFVLSGSGDKTLKLWDISTGKEITTFSGHANDATSVAFSPDGRTVLSGSGDKTLKLWDISTGREINIFSRANTSIIESVAYGQNGRLVVSSNRTVHANHTNQVINKTIKLWDINAGREIRSYSSHSNIISSLALSPDGKLALSYSGDQTMKLWEINTGKEIRTFIGHSDRVNAVALSPDGRFALSGSRDKTVKLWYTNTGRTVRTFMGHSETVNAVAFSPDGKFALSGSSDKTVKLWEINTGRGIRTFTGDSGAVGPDDSGVVNTVSFSPDGRFVQARVRDFLFWDIKTGERESFKGQDHGITFSPDGKFVMSGDDSGRLTLCDVNSRTDCSSFFGHAKIIDFADSNPHETLDSPSFTENKLPYYSIVFTPDGKHALSGSWDGVLKLWDLKTGAGIKTFSGGSAKISSVAVSSDGRFALSGDSEGVIRHWDISTGKEIASVISFADGEWIVITPEGYYNASENGDKYLNIRIGNNVYGIENYREAFFRPDLVKVALLGKSLKDYRNIASVKLPPKVSIVDTSDKAEKDEATISVKLIDAGGGIGDIRLYLNGSAVILDNGRGLKLVEKKDEHAVYKTYTIKLTNGVNKIRTIAFNGDNTMQSNDATHTITASFRTNIRPSLHALVIGINDYNNPKLQLTYARDDAVLFADTLKQAASGLFEQVNINRLMTPETTTNENIIKELKAMRTLQPDDLFVFYVASHGTVDDGEYYLITSNVGSTRTERLKTDAISQTILKEMVSNIPTTKKVIIIDTCNAGALGDALQIAMLTRGMSEDTAMKVLSRAVGSTILSASTSVQEALEGYNGHGLFTFVLSEGLNGKADKSKSGYIKTTELADYVDNEVPELAEKVFKKKQYPTISISGQAFPIGKVK